MDPCCPLKGSDPSINNLFFCLVKLPCSHSLLPTKVSLGTPPQSSLYLLDLTHCDSKHFLLKPHFFWPSIFWDLSSLARDWTWALGRENTGVLTARLPGNCFPHSFWFIFLTRLSFMRSRTTFCLPLHFQVITEYLATTSYPIYSIK